MQRVSGPSRWLCGTLGIESHGRSGNPPPRAATRAQPILAVPTHAPPCGSSPPVCITHRSRLVLVFCPPGKVRLIRRSRRLLIPWPLGGMWLVGLVPCGGGRHGSSAVWSVTRVRPILAVSTAAPPRGSSPTVCTTHRSRLVLVFCPPGKVRLIRRSRRLLIPWPLGGIRLVGWCRAVAAGMGAQGVGFNPGYRFLPR